MKSPGTLILAIFAVLFGLAGAYYAKYYMGEKPVAAPEPPKAQLVPRAAADLVEGRTVTLGDVLLVSMTPEQLKKANLPRPFMTDPKQIIGRTLREPLAKGAVFQPTAFYPEGLGPSVAERLKAGYRAITIPLTNSPAELALVSPGMTVDIVFRTEPDKAQHIPETTVTLLERVEVLAIGEEMFVGVRGAATRDTRGRKDVTVTLSVTPEQANALKVVEGHGTMSLVMRSSKDDLLVGNPGPRTLAGLLALPAPKEPMTTQIYRRGQLTTMVFEGGVRTEAIAEAALPVAAEAPRAGILPVSQTVASAVTKPAVSGRGVNAAVSGHGAQPANSNDCGCGAR